jgi:3-dehydroquinate dehydratase type I
VKISTFCRSEEDAIRLLCILLEQKKKNKKVIILGMGKFGIITRVFGTMWGNEMIFAPIEKNEESAPEQLTKSQLENIIEEITN